jgi:flagellar basal-body rod modification protein FlgD
MSVVSQTHSVLSGLARTNDTTSVNRKANEDAQTRFLTLLTTQLRNQDPMNPLENAEVTSQLAQMSTVDGIERLNALFQQFITGQESAEAMQAAALVGRGVLVPGNNLILTEAGGIGGFELTEPADRVTLSIKDSTGREIAKLELDDVDAGGHNYVWDGTSIDGSAAADGIYTVAVTATRGDQTLKAGALEFGQVTGIVRGVNGTDLQVGHLGIFRFDDIRQIL